MVDLPTADDARALQTLTDTYGTGNVQELRTSRRVQWTGRHYASGLEGTAVANAQAEPVGRARAATTLADAVARDALTP
ncbi:hypothetical protein C8E95_0809 [Pseudonocardia autotrophica]|uniref:Uncharacterized protein n=1 Tax=Pseudonocardia autotrophica TaxID=2074 RepID=A0A1Y2N880_PSEAH|nr:hypothetical protein BG845_00892 [Pseudonocardia autotrophica]TDN71775.1 hypothetical protein C8E95_0809 [Pseudonocardia autotrophica]